METGTTWAVLGVGAAWLTILTKWLSWSVTTAIKIQFAEFKDRLTGEFAEKFQDAKLAAAAATALSREVETMHARIREVDDYAHRWRHAHAGPLQRCVLKLNIESSRDEF